MSPRSGAELEEEEKEETTATEEDAETEARRKREEAMTEEERRVSETSGIRVIVPLCLRQVKMPSGTYLRSSNLNQQ